MDIVVFMGPNKLESIRAIRMLTSSSLKDAKDFVELGEKNYTVAISDVPRMYENKVMQTLFAAGISAEISDEKTSVFRKIPFNLSDELSNAECMVQNPGSCKPSTIMPKKKTDASLKGYLKTVAALECQIWNQDRLINRLNRKATSLGKPAQIEKPKIEHFYTHKFDGVVMCISFLVMAGLFLYAVNHVNVRTFGDLFWFGILAIGCVFVIILISFLIADGLDRWSALPAYRNAINQYNKKIKTDQNRVQQELKLKQEVGRQITSVKAERQRTKDALNALYSLSIIHPTYRNLVAISSFYDYFAKGICTQLTGRDGAYAFYEEDLRFKRIESKLDTIIEKLNEITSNQEYLASLIRDGNATLHRIEQQNNSMLGKLDSIKENTAVTAYNTQCCAESTSVMESISIYYFLKQ